jgi:Tfp pilus assembly protein PilX
MRPGTEGMKTMDDKRVIALKGREAGGVLVTALVFAVVISLFVAGVAGISVGHLSRGSTESDYATAIQLADAGINYELRWLSLDSTNFNLAHQQYPKSGMPGPYTGTVPNIPGGGSFTVSVMNADGSGPWAPPNELLIRSTGTINGISRTVEITGQRRSLFGEYAIFAIVEGKLGGSNSYIVGNVGTNGGVWFSGGAATTNIQGELYYNGYPVSNPQTTPPPSNSGYEPGSNVWWNPDPVPWPTVSEIADQLFPGGLEYIKANHHNSRTMEFSESDPNYEIANAVNNPITNVRFFSGNDFRTFTEDLNIQDEPPSGNRYHDGDEGAYKKKVIIFPPGDYYFESFNLTNQEPIAILIDNAKGMVRWWVDGGNRQLDSFDAAVLFTSTDKNKFRMYYNNCSRLSILGRSTFQGSIYAHSDGCDDKRLPEIEVGGSSVINGSVIANDVNLHGNSRINFPNGGGGVANDDWALWYGFRNTWRELAPSGKPLFPDGTNR